MRTGHGNGHRHRGHFDGGGRMVGKLHHFKAVRHPVILRRPLGGWNARQWRREVFGWLWAALLVLLSWGACRALEGVLAVVFGVG